ncbi:MAG: hypothetical protein HYZ75_09750 [Elusimicrobia bacterium]|nr:hypothetical protein [Elusimicrobiota bacterium]
MLSAVLAVLLAAPAGAASTPGVLLRGEVKRRLIAADLLKPIDMARWEAAEAQWPSDPAWDGARKAAEGLAEFRGALTYADAESLEEGLRTLAQALDVESPGDDALAARYEPLRAKLLEDGVNLEPETERLRGPDGAPLDAKDWSTRLEDVPPAVRRNLFTVFGPACGIAKDAPKDPLLLVAKPKKAAKAKPAAAEKTEKPALKTAVKKPRLPDPVIARPGPKSDALSAAIKTLRAALDSPSLADKLKEPDKEALLKNWEKALEATTDDTGKTDWGNAVNGFKELLPNAWTKTAAATFNLGSDLGPKATLAAAFAASGARLGAERLITGALALAGQAKKPENQPGLGKAIDKSIAVETSAAAWAGSLPNPKKSNPVDGTVKTFKLEGAVRGFKGLFGI